MAKYVKCPRCELNYMKEGEEYCDVCKGELRMIAVSSDDEDLELCPICGTNFIGPDQTICDECQKKGATLDQVDRDETATETDWEDKVSEENDSLEDDVEVLSLSELAEAEDFDDDDDDEEDDPYTDTESEDHDDFDFDDEEIEDIDDDSDDDDDDDDDDDGDLF